MEEENIMKKIAMLGLVLTCFLSPVAQAAAVVDAGNTMCPVGGDKVSGKDFVEHEGKKYGLCCAMCAGKFNKNPEKYLKQMAEAAENHDDHDL